MATNQNVFAEDDAFIAQLLETQRTLKREREEEIERVTKSYDIALDRNDEFLRNAIIRKSNKVANMIAQNENWEQNVYMFEIVAETYEDLCSIADANKEESDLYQYFKNRFGIPGVFLFERDNASFLFDVEIIEHVTEYDHTYIPYFSFTFNISPCDDEQLAFLAETCDPFLTNMQDCYLSLVDDLHDMYAQFIVDYGDGAVSVDILGENRYAIVRHFDYKTMETRSVAGKPMHLLELLKYLKNREFEQEEEHNKKPLR